MWYCFPMAIGNGSLYPLAIKRGWKISRRNGFPAGKIIYKYQWRVFRHVHDHRLPRFISGMVSERIQILQEWMFLGTGWFWDDSLSSMNIAAETSPWFPLISYSRNIFGGPVYPKKNHGHFGNLHLALIPAPSWPCRARSQCSKFTAEHWRFTKGWTAEPEDKNHVLWGYLAIWHLAI